MSNSCAQVSLVGRLTTDTTVDRFPRFAIRAIVESSGQAVAETVSTERGEFVLALPLVAGAAYEVLITVRAVDDAGKVLSEARITPHGGATQAVVLPVAGSTLHVAEPVSEGEPSLELLIDDSVAALRRKVTQWAAEGVLENDAPAVLHQALQPLEWAAGLMEDARGTLDGRLDAAARLRAALLGLGAGADAPARPQASEREGEPDLEEGLEADLPPGMRVIDGNAVALLAAAVVRAAPDVEEGQEMLNGLAAVLWSRPFVEMLLRAANLNQPAPMRPLMGGLSPGWGIPPRLPGEPRLPGGTMPGWPIVPKPKEKLGVESIFRRFPDLTPTFNRMPTEDERCLVGAMVIVDRLKRETPQYEIHTISNPRACPGETITLTGINFGVSGVVLFQGKGGDVVATDVALWSDTEIRVRVPQGATPGQIRLSILIALLRLCDRDWAVYRLGKSIPYFNGGVPAVLSFTVDGKRPAVLAEPDAEISTRFVTSVGEGVNARVVIRQGATTLLTRDFAGGSHSFTFHTPAVTAPADISATLTASNHCGISQEIVIVSLARRPDLKILQAEVTQGIQRLDNTVRLAARRRTVVRVYLDSGLAGNFAYADSPRSLPGVTGSVTLYRGGQNVGVVGPVNAPYTVRTVFFPVARESVEGSLTSCCRGNSSQLHIKVWVQDPPRGLEPSMFTEDLRTINVDFEPTNGISIVRVMIQDNWRMLPAPSLAEWQSALLGARSRFPVPEDGWTIRLHPSAQTITVNEDLSTDGGWNGVLEALDDIAADVEDGWDHRWAGLLPAMQPGNRLKWVGLARTGIRDNDYLAFAAIAGLPTTFAHEFGHSFGVNHAGCPTGPNAPKNVDPTLPGTIEETAIDVNTFATFQANASGELMSYCKEFERFPSIVLWHQLMDVLRK